MVKRRTDLALEGRELWQEGAEGQGEVPGVSFWEGEREGFAVTGVEILDSAGEAALGRPRGRYVTLELDGLLRRENEAFSRGARALAGELRGFLRGVQGEGPVLVVGLGNRAITPDAVGPLVCRHTLVTRHLVGQMPEEFGHLRPVAALAAEVLGNTGVESGQVVRAVCGEIRPACVVAVDALASRSLKRLCRTVQLTDTGITPGSGVGNHRLPLTGKSLGVPVIAVGVPTVVEAATLAADLTGREAEERPGETGGMFVTPRDIDSRVAELGKVLGFGISLALQPGLTVAELELLLG